MVPTPPFPPIHPTTTFHAAEQYMMFSKAPRGLRGGNYNTTSIENNEAGYNRGYLKKEREIKRTEKERKQSTIIIPIPPFCPRRTPFNTSSKSQGSPQSPYHSNNNRPTKAQNPTQITPQPLPTIRFPTFQPHIAWRQTYHLRLPPDGRRNSDVLRKSHQDKRSSLCHPRIICTRITQRRSHG